MAGIINFRDKLDALTRQLYPTGRAFKMPKNGWLESLHRGLALSENKAYNDALAILNSILPDNEYFTEEDAGDWERRLGMIDSTGVPLATRKLAIKRKMNFPGSIKARQHYLYIQGQLRAAGFDVYVYENRFDDGMGGYVTKSPVAIGGYGGIAATQHKTTIEHGQRQHGGSWGNFVVNNIEQADDLSFNVGSNLRSTFFIGGPALESYPGTYAYVPTMRKAEFRQLILKLKPVQTLAYLFIVYT